jgi:hypothetical protein
MIWQHTLGSMYMSTYSGGTGHYITITRQEVDNSMNRIQAETKPRLYKVARFYVFVLRYEWMVHHVYQGQPLLRLELQ